MADVYNIVKEEGVFLAKELEKLRRKKETGKVVVTCKRETSDEIKRYKRAFLLNEGTTQLFYEAKGFCAGIDEHSMFLDIEAETCHVVYKFDDNVNWKIIDLEIIDKELVKEVITKHKQRMGRAEVYAFLVIVSFAYKYGYSNVFCINEKQKIKEFFKNIIDCEDMGESEFGLESKVTEKIFREVMKTEFCQNYSPIFKV